MCVFTKSDCNVVKRVVRGVSLHEKDLNFARGDSVKIVLKLLTLLHISEFIFIRKRMKCASALTQNL